MGNRCLTCKHPEVESINQELIEGKSVRDIAGRYGRSPTGIHRHSRNCVADRVAEARAAGIHACIALPLIEEMLVG